jgi:hypothetical protein
MAQPTLRKAAMAPLALIGLAISTAPVSAKDTSAATTPPGASKAQARTLAQMRQHIAALERQVKRLEGRIDALTAGAATVAVPPALATAPPEDQLALAPLAALPVQGTAPPPAARPVAPKSAVGAFDIDEEAAQRALERTLTQRGALLLAPRRVTITPILTYTLRETAELPVPATIPTVSGSFPALLNTRSRRHEATARLDLKAGLPLDAQLELSLPYTHVSQSLKTDLSAETTASGSGDLSVGVAKTLQREKGWRPDLIGRLTYGAGNGRLQEGPVFLGSGFRSMQAELVALKRQDPLAFIAGLTYNRSFAKDAVRPGDAAGFSLAALLAASPATSLQFGFSQTFRKETEDSGIRRSGSKEAFGLFTIGASTILTRDMMLNAVLGIGLGSDAPRYSLTFSLPVAF